MYVGMPWQGSVEIFDGVATSSMGRALPLRVLGHGFGGKGGPAAAPAYNNVVRASARLRRAPGYTAPKACGHVNELEEVWRAMADGHSCWRRVGNPERDIASAPRLLARVPLHLWGLARSLDHSVRSVTAPQRPTA